MNCKPGDLAYVIRGRNYGTLVLVGKAFHINASGKTKFGAFTFLGNERSWLCRAVGRPLLDPFAGKVVQFYERPIPDSALRPIRDPGDDAVDETLLRLPAPETETA
jgi:hypothetical protein